MVFDSMNHLGGRRLPHAAERSRGLMRAHGSDLLRAELLGGFVERIAGFDRLDAERLRRAGADWRALPVGGKLVREWPPYRRLVPLAARARQASRRPATARMPHRVR